MVADIIARLVGGLILATGGWGLGGYISDIWAPTQYLSWVFGLSAGGAIAGLIATPLVMVRTVRVVVRQVEGVPTSRLLSGILGLVIGLLIALLVSIPLSRISGWAGVGLPIALSVFLAYLGMMLLTSPNRDIFRQLMSNSLASLRGNGHRTVLNGRILLDTSAIIDGRVAAISQTGFLRGTLVIPRFILDELRHVADSKDSLRRNRGRRGLEMLNKLREDAQIPIEILDVDDRNGQEVDSKLVELAKDLSAAILTTDYNLNRVAQIQGVSVLNVNELANTLRPVVLPGETISIKIVQEGKEPGQGVGFLDDGTMVVVASGQHYLGHEVEASVTRVLQTAAGCIIFAQTRRG